MFLLDNSQLADVSALEGWAHPLFAVTIRSSPGSPIRRHWARGCPLADGAEHLAAGSAGGDPLAALSGLTEVGGLSLVESPGVTDLSPLAGVTEAGWIVPDGMPGVTTLAGLGGLTKLDNISASAPAAAPPVWTG